VDEVYKHVDMDPVAMPCADVEDAPDVKTTITAINRRSPRRRLYKIISSVWQASDYEKMKAFLIYQIKKTFSHGNNIATALDQLSLLILHLSNVVFRIVRVQKRI
jgi:hypothetical protein